MKYSDFPDKGSLIFTSLDYESPERFKLTKTKEGMIKVEKSKTYDDDGFDLLSLEEFKIKYKFINDHYDTAWKKRTVNQWAIVT